jgi:esterase/lipase superfamily enzyme
MMTATPPIAAAIARHWQQIEACFPDPDSWKAFSLQLLELLRELDEPRADVAATTARIQQLFATAPAARDLVRKSMVTTQPSQTLAPPSLGSPWRPPAPGQPPPGAAPPGPRPLPETAELTRHRVISVLYGTDRTPLETEGGRARYANDSAQNLSFGVATVSLPDNEHHKIGRLERPRWYCLEFRENPDKHVVITAVDRLGEQQFIERARAARIGDDSTAEAMVFVHGFNVGFEDSIRRTAQFAADLDFRGMAIAYSWPSKSSLFAYSADANISEPSMFMLTEFIGMIRSKLGLSRIHLIAHSMGNRLLVRALNQHVLTVGDAPGAELRQVVFAAPDIDPATFGGFAKVFADKCERCTLYASSRDLALVASRWIYRRPRAGAVAGLVSEYGVDAIDVSQVDNSMLGHSYFSDKRVLLIDLNALLRAGVAPDERPVLEAVVLGDGRYWKFRA